jgi:hypothetical protein
VADWKAISVQIPGKDLLKDIRQILETLLIYLDVLKAILETIKLFLIDFGNPIRALVEALLALINSLIESLKRSGVYAYYDIPNPLDDTSFRVQQGGYEAFITRFASSLYDEQDINRPKPISGATVGGYIVVLVDAQGPVALIALLKTLLQFFGREFYRPAYAAPANVKAIPVGDKGDPLLSLAAIFNDPPKAVALEWSLPSVTGVSDPSFAGLAGQLGNEFIPPKWLIEKSDKPITSSEVFAGFSSDGLTDDSKVGVITSEVPTQYVNPRTNQVVWSKVKVKDASGDAAYKFKKYYEVSLSSGTGTFLFGQLGTYRWIDTDVEYGKTYYYRVRAFSGSLNWKNKAKGLLNLSINNCITANMNDGGIQVFEYPAASGSTVVMGRASGLVTFKFTQIPEDFDLYENLRRLFMCAFSLNFHMPLPTPAPVVNSSGDPVLDADGNPQTYPLFSSEGDPLPPYTTVEDVGKGTIDTLSGTLASFEADPVVNLLGDQSYWKVDAATGKYPEMPWQKRSVRFMSARLANRFAGFFMETSDTLITGFQGVMQGTLPEGRPPTADKSGSTIANADTLEKLVFALTESDPVYHPSHTAKVLPTGSTVSQAAAATYGSAFSDIVVRKNVRAAIQYLRSIGGQGVPPNWESISILRDLIPWSGQLLYDMLAKIQALLDAYEGVVKEIEAFIDLLIRKIDALELFIQYLINLLNYIESLSLGFYFLDSGLLHGGPEEWVDTMSNAGGQVPASGPDGYCAGLAFAYLGTDVGAFVEAFGMIF